MNDTRDQLLAMLDAFGTALNSRDAHAVAQFWAEEGNFIDQWGHLAIGRDGVERLFAEHFAAELAQSRFRAMRVDVRLLSDDNAIGECDAVYEHVLAPNGKPYDLPYRVDAVFVRRHGEWRYLSAHPSFRRA